MTHTLLYLDSSAILKIIVAEPESQALFKFLKDWPLRISSELARTEVLRALRRAGATVPEFRRGQKTLQRIDLIPVDSRIINDAAMLKPPALRTLDAVHLATALSVRPELAAVVTYDGRFSEAATGVKLSVWSPH